MRILVLLFVFASTAAQAATVSLSGTVLRVTGADDFVDSVPIIAGDAFNMTGVTVDAPTGFPGSFNTLYRDVFQSLAGTVGGYGFSLSTTASANFPIPANQITVQNDNSSGADRVDGRVTVQGADVAGYEARLLNIALGDDTATTLTDESFDPTLVDQSYVDTLSALPPAASGFPQVSATATLQFRTDAARPMLGTIFIDLRVAPAPIAPVPLPASGLLLLGGLVLAGMAGRRTHKP